MSEITLKHQKGKLQNRYHQVTYREYNDHYLATLRRGGGLPPKYYVKCVILPWGYADKYIIDNPEKEVTSVEDRISYGPEPAR